MDKILGEYIKGILRGLREKIFSTPHISPIRGSGRLKFFFSHGTLRGTCPVKISVLSIERETRGKC